MPKGGHNKNTLESILARIEKNEKGCWNWVGSKDSNGYGNVSYHGKLYKTHRLIYTLMIEEIQEGLFCCHSCDNPACINPEHIFLGTNLDNMRDKVNKGRHAEQLKTHCSKGHSFSGDNLMISKGRRYCRICKRNRTKISRDKQNNISNE